LYQCDEKNGASKFKYLGVIFILDDTIPSPNPTELQTMGQSISLDNAADDHNNQALTTHPPTLSATAKLEGKTIRH